MCREDVPRYAVHDAGAQVGGAGGEGVEGDVLRVAQVVVAVEGHDDVGEEEVDGACY